MRTIIIYATKHGFTKMCATKLSKKLEGEVDVQNLKENKDIRLEQYDKVIIGGSIYMGQIQKEVKDFCTINLEKLKSKKVSVFICCSQEGENANTELNNSFPQELLTTAVAKGFLGGGFTFKNMGFFEKLIIKKVAKTSEDTSSFSEEKLNAFATAINNLEESNYV